MMSKIAQALKHTARFLLAAITVDFDYFGKLREVLGRPRVFYAIFAAVLIVYTIVGIKAVRKKKGAIRRSRQMGLEFRKLAANREHCEKNLAIHQANTKRGLPTAESIRYSYNLYEPTGLHRPYPVTFAMFFAPMSYLPLKLLRLLWYLMQILLLLLAAFIADRLASEWFPAWPRYRWAMLGLTLLWTTRFLQRDFSGGQVNLLTFMLCLVTIYLIHRGHGFAAGAPLGLALMIKLTPLLLVAYLFYRRLWRPALAALTIGIALFALPYLFLGAPVYHANTAYWHKGVQTMNQPDLHENRYSVMIVPFSWGNQSLRYAIFRYVTTYPQSRADRPAWGYIDFANLSPKRAQRVIKVILFLLLLGIALIFGLRAPDTRTLPFFVECAIVLVLMLVLSPITWKAHFVYLMLGFFLMITYGACQQSRTPWRYLLPFFVLCVAVNRSTLGEVGEDLHQAYYINTLGLLIVLAGLCHLLILARRSHFGVVGIPVK